MRKLFLKGQTKIFNVFLLCTAFTTIFFVYEFKHSHICPENEFILTFEDSKNPEITLWSHLSILAVSKIIPQWHPYAPNSAIKKLSRIYEKTSINVKNFNRLSWMCQLFGKFSHQGKFKTLHLKTNTATSFLDLIFLAQNEIINNLKISNSVVDKMTIFVDRQVNRLVRNGTQVDSIVIIVKHEGERDTNVTNFYLEQVQNLMDSVHPLFIVVGNKGMFEKFQESKRIIEFRDFSMPQTIHLISRSNHLIIGGNSLEHIFYSLFATQHVHIFRPISVLRTMTKSLERWHHYF